MDPPNGNDTLVIDGREPNLKRALILIARLVSIALPTWDLRHAFTQLGWWTIFVGTILVGACALGVTLVIGAVAGDGLIWTFRDGVLILQRSSLLRKRTDTIREADVARTEIRRVEWDSRADSFSVVVHLKSGERLETPDRATRTAAESLEVEIRRRLGLA